MEIVALLVCILILIPLQIFGNWLRMKYKNTKGFLLLQFVWFLLCAVSFIFFLKPEFTRIQNIAVGAFIGGALVYFFFRFRNIIQNSNTNNKSGSHLHSSKI